MGCVRARPAAHKPYQSVDPREGVVRVVQGLDQLVHAIVGLAISIETNAHRSTASKSPRLEVTSGEGAYLKLCFRATPGSQQNRAASTKSTMYPCPLHTQPPLPSYPAPRGVFLTTD